MKRDGITSKVALGVVWLLLLCGGCGDESPTGPRAPTEYPFYFQDGNYQGFYYRFLPSNGKIDTFQLPYWSDRGFTASVDGKLVYVAAEDQSIVAVLSSDSFHVIRELPYSSGSGISESSKSHLLAMNGPDLCIVRAGDYSIVYMDTSGSSGGSFSACGSSYYSLSNGGVTKIDLEQPVRKSTKVLSGPIIVQVAPSIDESSLFLYRMYSDFLYAFAVYDVKRDSIIFEQGFAPGAGRFVVDPLGRYVFISNPGNLLSGPPPSSGFFVYDVRANKMLDMVQTRWPTGDTSSIKMPIDAMAITPDGRTLVAGGTLGHGQFLTFDIGHLAIEKYDSLGEHVRIWNTTCQGGL
jgi:hypothetical protein